MRVIAIDPGAKNLGVAFFKDDILWRAWLCPTADLHMLTNLRSHVIVIEKPQIYPKQKGDPNDLIDLAIIAGRIAESCRPFVGEDGPTIPHVVYYKPAVWKGQTPKEIHHERIKKHLERQGVLSCVEIPRAKSLAHNVWDAVGLGLYHLTKRK